MCPSSAGMISSERLFEIHFQSSNFGPRSWRTIRGPATELLTALLGFGLVGELADGVYAEGAAHPISIRDHYPAFYPGPYQLRERVLEVHPLAQAGHVPFTVRRVELCVRDAQEREPLQDPVGAHEGRDEL